MGHDCESDHRGTTRRNVAAGSRLASRCTCRWRARGLVRAIPVTDVDRAKAFYVDQPGFVADQDHVDSEELRVVQLTPPGSSCSVTIGPGLTATPPGSAPGCSSSSPTSRRRAPS